MRMWTMIPVLLVTMFFVVLTWWQRHSRKFIQAGAETKQPLMKKGMDALSATDTEAMPGIIMEEAWWKNLGRHHQLQLALHLARKALPVWEKFTALQQASYRTTAAGPLTVIDSDLLQQTVEEISLHARLYSPGADITKINQYHKRFIGPVLALKDGIWVCAYPVKKIFLSVYFILMSIVEQHSSAANENYLRAAINAALECMELSKLYTREEITSFFTGFEFQACI